MDMRTILVVGLAMIFGVSAAVGVSRMAGNAPAATVETVPIVLAAVEIPRGAEVTSVMLTTGAWPKDQLPEGAIATTEEAVGRTAIIPLLKGEPLLKQKVSEEGFGRGVAPLVAPGMRAFTVMTPTLTSGVGGLLLPGNKVDVLWTDTSRGLVNQKNDDGTGGGATVTLLQNVEVLAADRQIGEEAEKASGPLGDKDLRSVTLQVSEADAKKLSLAQQKGTINLALRNGGDGTSNNSPIVTLNDIRYAQGRPPEEKKPAKPGLLKLLSGMKPIRPEPSRTVRVRIRTLRGRHPGDVQLELYGKAAIPNPPPAPRERKEALAEKPAEEEPSGGQ